MKQETENNAVIINFQPLEDLMLAAYNQRIYLADALADIWNLHHKTVDVSVFRKQFIAWAMKKPRGYSEDHAKSVLIDAGIRVRALRSDSGKGKGKTSKADPVAAVIKSIEARHLTPKQMKSLVAQLEALIG